jgi:hypothetical protein
VWSILHGVHLNVSKATITTAIRLVASVTSDRKNTTVKDAARSSGKLAAYTLKIMTKILIPARKQMLSLA